MASSRVYNPPIVIKFGGDIPRSALGWLCMTGPMASQSSCGNGSTANDTCQTGCQAQYVGCKTGYDAPFSGHCSTGTGVNTCNLNEYICCSGSTVKNNPMYGYCCVVGDGRAAYTCCVTGVTATARCVTGGSGMPCGTNCTETLCNPSS